MAPLTRPISDTLPELPLEAPSVQSKDLQSACYSTASAHLPRLVTLKSKSGSCTSCSSTSTKACADCCLVFYCNDICQTAHWPDHKKSCHDLQDQNLNEVIEARERNALDKITDYLGKILSSDFKSQDYKDTKLSVKIDDFASFGDFYDVLDAATIRSFHPGTYKCTSLNSDESFAPITIYHHVYVDPVKIMKQCILMQKQDILKFEHDKLPNQINMPQSCNWESADEYISNSESETSDSEASESDLLFADFVGRVFDDKPAMESDTEDQGYDYFSETESESSTVDASEVSDHEFNYLIDEGKQYIRDVPQKRQSIAPAADMEVVDGEDGEDSEAEAYKHFKEKVFESEHKYTSDIDDSDYLPYSDSDSYSEESIPERDISDSEKCISDNEVEIMLDHARTIHKEKYNEFLENMVDRFYIQKSDLEDQDYTPVDDSKVDVKEVSVQTRKCHSSEDEASQDSNNEAVMEADDALYYDFRTNLVVNDPLKIEELGDSDEEFVPTVESQESKDESQDEGSHASDQSDDQMDVSDDEIKDLELSLEDEIYEDINELIYFINSKYASSLKYSLENNTENGSEIAGSLLLKNGSESFGIAVDMKGQTWRHAHVFEDTTSGKCFAIVISTDTLEHLSNKHEHLQAHYPDQWSSISKREPKFQIDLKFQMKDFLC